MRLTAFERESLVSICTSYFRLYLKELGDTTFFKISEMRQEGKSTILKDIEMRPTIFERESFVSVYTSFIFVFIS